MTTTTIAERAPVLPTPVTANPIMEALQRRNQPIHMLVDQPYPDQTLCGLGSVAASVVGPLYAKYVTCKRCLRSLGATS